MRRDAESEPSPREFGSDIHAEYDLWRHEEPRTDPESGASLDELSEQGAVRAAAAGRKLHGTVKGYASPMQRAQRTVDLAFQNAADDAEILNRRVEEVGNEEVRKGREGRAFVIRTKQELRTVQGIEAVGKEAAAKAKEAGIPPENALDYRIQYYLDHPERARELGAQTPHEVATELAYNVRHFGDMTERFRSGSKMNIRAITHGPKIEPFIREIIIREEGGKIVQGFDRLEEIGGSFKPGEGPKFLIHRDENGNETIRMLLRGKEYGVDTERLRQLSEEYIERQKAAKESA